MIIFAALFVVLFFVFLCCFLFAFLFVLFVYFCLFFCFVLFVWLVALLLLLFPIAVVIVSAVFLSRTDDIIIKYLKRKVSFLFLKIPISVWNDNINFQVVYIKQILLSFNRITVESSLRDQCLWISWVTLTHQCMSPRTDMDSSYKVM